jgi:hypothetical protein
MLKIRYFGSAFLVAFTLLAGSVHAEDSSYTLGTVWELSYIKTEPGQFENYVDWLSKAWVKEQEFGRKEGYLVSYHVLNVNHTRANEPDLILAVEYKDYMPTADRLAAQRKFEAYVASSARKMDEESGGRKVMRTLEGSIEAQELKLK